MLPPPASLQNTAKTHSIAYKLLLPAKLVSTNLLLLSEFERCLVNSCQPLEKRWMGVMVG